MKEKTKEEKDMFDPESDPPSTNKITTIFCKLAVPSCVTNFVAMIPPLTNTYFAARMNDPTKLAAIGLANVILMLMVQSLLTGLNSAQETLTSQAFGNGNLRLCGVNLNRGRFILIAFFIPLAIVPCIFGE